MIIKMAKVEIVGPKQNLLEVLDVLRSKGIFHPEPRLREGTPGAEAELELHALEPSALAEQGWLLTLHRQVEMLLELLPSPPLRTVYLRPAPIAGVLAELAPKHLDLCRQWQQRQQSLREECARWTRFAGFWKALEPLVREIPADSNLDFLGVTIRDPGQLPALRELLQQRTAGHCQLDTAQMEDGTLVGLIAIAKPQVEGLRRLLETEKLPEMTVPDELQQLSFRDKTLALARNLAECEIALAEVETGLQTFARRWRPIYLQALRWLEQRLAVFQASSAAYQTRSCFFINGWVIGDEVPVVHSELEERFAGTVVVDERQIHVEELERVPVILKNPPYFEPFELLTRFLPLPRYSSYDPTPFIGLFFPLLFGMTLGDAGYGLLLVLTAAVLVTRRHASANLVAAGKILGVCAGYTIIFGLLFGELFGDLGRRLLGLHPLWIDRAEALAPMIGFTLAVGAGHVLVGLVVGIRSAWRQGKRKEALFKLLSAVLLLLIGLVVVDLLQPQAWLPGRPLLIAIGVLLPLLVTAGGLLAPLELLKGIGNIISYVRIMAIGLSSVLLAVVANQLGGMTGELVLGILIAALLHAFNLLLGVFAPTVHVLRLHYVEFFSKFLELGGRHFEPLGK